MYFLNCKLVRLATEFPYVNLKVLLLAYSSSTVGSNLLLGESGIPCSPLLGKSGIPCSLLSGAKPPVVLVAL